MITRSSSGFLHLRQGISHCIANTQDTTYTTERVEEKKNKQALIWFSSKHKKGEAWALFLHSMLLWLSRARTRKFPGTLTYPITLADPASGSAGPSSKLSSRLSLTSSSLCSRFSSSSSGLPGNLARKSFVWVSRQNRQRNPLTGTRPPSHSHKWMPNIEPHLTIWIIVYLGVTPMKEYCTLSRVPARHTSKSLTFRWIM